MLVDGRSYSEGLIGLSACLGGHVSRTLREGGLKAAREMARDYRDIFEPGSYYLEVQPNGMVEQEEANAEKVRVAEDRIQTQRDIAAANLRSKMQ